jgi:hypothetical protein
MGNQSKAVNTITVNFDPISLTLIEYGDAGTVQAM